MTVNFSNRGSTPPPLFIDGAAVEVVHTFNHLGVHLFNALTWQDLQHQKCSTAAVLPEEAKEDGAEH